MRKPGIFVSSTFYDLKQIRADLRDFIEEQLGYAPLISELASFPVDPDSDTIENSKKRVQDSADVLLLIVGSRYGTIPNDRGKSITNIEYEIARAKGIPIYAFVEKSVLSTLPAWRDNRESDFSSVVDTSQLFEFVDQVRSEDRVWTFPFESAQEIIEALRNQLAFQMTRGLEILAKLKTDSDQYRELTGEALRISIDKELAWQGKLFAKLIDEELHTARDLKRAFDLGIYIGAGERINEDEALNWVGAKAEEAARLASGIAHLVNTALNEAFASLDIQEIAFSAREVGRVYREALEWSLGIRRAYIEDNFVKLRDELSLMISDVIKQIEEFSPRLIQVIEDGILSSEDEVITINLEFVISVANEDEFYKELNRVKSIYGL